MIFIPYDLNNGKHIVISNALTKNKWDSSPDKFIIKFTFLKIKNKLQILRAKYEIKIIKNERGKNAGI